MVKINKDDFVEICNNAESLAKARIEYSEKHFLMNMNTFRKYAKQFGCYSTNQSGKGISKNKPVQYELKDILNGLHPQFSTNCLRQRLIKEHVFEYKCAECGITNWQDRPISLALDHIDGDNSNHKLENLRLLCPNCHALTKTYRIKNIKKDNMCY